MIKVLFVCIHNSARSQMAEAFLNTIAGDRFIAESAGLEPGTLNQDVVKVMLEDGIDISSNTTKDVFDFFKQGRMYDYVVTVCDAEAAERCPIFPGLRKRFAWSFADPAAISGTLDERLKPIREIRDQIRAAVESFITDREVETYI